MVCALAAQTEAAIESIPLLLPALKYSRVPMTEERKHAILFVATLLVVRTDAFAWPRRGAHGRARDHFQSESDDLSGYQEIRSGEISARGSRNSQHHVLGPCEQEEAGEGHRWQSRTLGRATCVCNIRGDKESEAFRDPPSEGYLVCTTNRGVRRGDPLVIPAGDVQVYGTEYFDPPDAKT